MMNILDQMKTLPLADATFDLETILRIAVFGTFIGHGWIAAWKLEFSGWVKVRRLMYTQLRLALLRPAPPCSARLTLTRRTLCADEYEYYGDEVRGKELTQGKD